MPSARSLPVSRRAVLTGACVLVGATALGAVGVAADVLPGSAGIRRRLGWNGPDGVVPSVPRGLVSAQSLESAARGTQVHLVTIVPEGVPAAGLPVLLALHGRGADAQTLVDLGLPELLTAAVRAGASPFAIAAVDGGDSYWHRRSGDDPQAMLHDEVPGWLTAGGFGPVFGALGISMGGFGALLWARGAGSASRPAAIIAVSPALFSTWADAKARNVFADEADWAASEPLRHVDAIDGSTLGVWCGAEDPFAAQARELASKAHAAVSRFDSGAHDDGYWRRVLPEALAFAGAAAATSEQTR